MQCYQSIFHSSPGIFLWKRSRGFVKPVFCFQNSERGADFAPALLCPPPDPTVVPTPAVPEAGFHGAPGSWKVPEQRGRDFPTGIPVAAVSKDAGR